LEALRAQTVSTSRWELLIIDNASEPPVDAGDLSWHPRARVISETIPGLSFARVRGIREAIGDLLVFVDDDNVLDPDYLATALTIKETWPMLGTWGSGTIRPEFEMEPAAHLAPFLNYLSLRNNTRPFWGNVIIKNESAPTGAGLCVRSHVAAEYASYFSKCSLTITGRCGNGLLGGDDYEICFTGCKMGFGMGVFPELRMLHLIPSERVSDSYFIRLLEGTDISLMLLSYKWNANPRKPRLLSLVRPLMAALQCRGFNRQVAFSKLRAMLEVRRILGSAQS
jgi:glycosyltransferase involved in cell wall biosynthesis